MEHGIIIDYLHKLLHHAALFAKAHKHVSVMRTNIFCCQEGSLAGIMMVDSGELPYLPLCLNKNEGAKLIYI